MTDKTDTSDRQESTDDELLDIPEFLDRRTSSANKLNSEDVRSSTMKPGQPQKLLLSAAISYVENGWSVLPLHGITHDGKCTCSKTDCDKTGKHPRTKHGLNDATQDPKQIENWWKRWPDANVGIATGQVSGLVALDIDPRHGGDDALENLEKTLG